VPIVFEKVHKSFGDLKVIRGLDLEVQDEESLVILGRSGSGKSVMLKLALGILSPDKGRILVDGEDINLIPLKELYSLRQRFGMLFQGAALFDSLMVWENVAFTMIEHEGKKMNEVMPLVQEKLMMVGMPDVEYKYPAELSGGMKKRVGLARAIASNPKYLLYDEPTTGLDPIMADVINNLIIKMKKELGTTSIVVTHDIVSATKVGTRLVMLYDGVIIWSGTPEETHATDNPYVKQFIAGSAEGPIEVLT
jgi:phospholipid/cholesterol/gamma-HCH transport system ATP-binding protein